MTDSKKILIKKIIELIISFIVGAAVATGIINYDKIVKVAFTGESIKNEQQTSSVENITNTTTSVENTIK